MRVAEVIKKLSKERPDEEVIIVMGEDRSNYYVLEDNHFLHAGPANFHDENGNHYFKSVVLLRVKKKTNPPK
tara:strand:- start:309 stop:524 length:216 start_codon:yes stop_codon:yes gene_type:complete